MSCGGGGGGGGNTGSNMNAIFSKSETNLCASAGQMITGSNGTKQSPGAGGCNKKLAVFSVVSLNDLHETDDVAFGAGGCGDNSKPMNDLSKNLTLNTISSNDDIYMPRVTERKRDF